MLRGSDLLNFANVPPLELPVYPVPQHLAEKLHAYTLPRDEPNTRVKDLVDMVSIAAIDRVEADALTLSVRATFGARATHAVPQAIPDPPSDWQPQYARLAGESPTAPTLELAQAVLFARTFWNPPLAGNVVGRTWNPHVREWT